MTIQGSATIATQNFISGTGVFFRVQLQLHSASIAADGSRSDCSTHLCMHHARSWREETVVLPRAHLNMLQADGAYPLEDSKLSHESSEQWASVNIIHTL